MEENLVVFPNEAAEFIYFRTYSRWVEELERREKDWSETVNRYINFITKERGDLIPKKVLRKLKSYMLSFDVMPSMRAVWTAGKAAEADNTCMYNCAFQLVDSVDAFAECLYILMCGTGYGFSVKAEDVEKLPTITQFTGQQAGTYIVEDSKAGWANSLKVLMDFLYTGQNIEMDYSHLRPKGARLKTMGGRSSGPEPLAILHNFIKDTFAQAQGRRLKTIECLDIMNRIATIVEVGGVRRSSQISLSDLDDQEIRNAKIWPFPHYRAMSNNSAIYVCQPNAIDFLGEWAALASSGTGERGIFNLEGARKHSPVRRNQELIKGVNPCAEILLRSKQFCNLSEVIIKPTDDLDDLLDKVETATWIGAIQSTFTHFPYLQKKWKENCEEERLLGVSLTGQMDNKELLTPDALKAMKRKASKVARHASNKLGINMPAAITCVKPSGTVSQLVNSASGLHTRHSKYYIRRYRISANDPLFRMLKKQGVPCSPENGQRKKDWNRADKLATNNEQDEAIKTCPIWRNDGEWRPEYVTTWVLTFPIKSPKGSILKGDLSAIDQLNHYKMLQEHWCEHNASATIYCKDFDWFEVGNWVYKNWDIINGVSFFPADTSKYEQSPYEVISRDKYLKLKKKFPKIDYTKLTKFELEDATEGSRALACTGDKCDV